MLHSTPAFALPACRLLLVLFVLPSLAFAQPFGLSNRLANTTLAFPQQPLTFGYALSNAFPTVAITNPIGFATPPGETNRLFILERSGLVVAITNLAAPDRTVVLNLNSLSNKVDTGGECGLLGLAFHPNFPSNRFFYVFYSHVGMTSSSTGRHQRLVRFEMSATNGNFASVTNEVALISQFDEASNHNGGDIHFGTDGYLYISLGDEGNPQGDGRNNSQTIRKDFFSGVLRIDVDKKAGNLQPNPHPAQLGVTNYLVPADNPWTVTGLVSETNVTGQLRTEFFAAGLRNPWRTGFDELTGKLWVGDVGGTNVTSREEVNIIVKGGNYGWAFTEAFEAGPKAAQTPVSFTNVPPITYYLRGSGTLQGQSVTGGRVYRGANLAQLYGKYVFGDYSSGNLWALTPDGTNYVSLTNTQFLLDAGADSIAAFGVDPRNGDLLAAFVATSGTNAIRRLVYSNTSTGTALPATLVAAGAFSNFTTLTPHAGIVPCSLNVPSFSDNALKSHWFSVPNTNFIIGWNASNNWTFPTGTVWIQHFDLVTNYLTSTSTRLETRFLVKTTGGVYGATYRWGGATNATLVAEAGTNEAFVITDPGGLLRTQVWRYPSRGECLVCHHAGGGFAPGFHTAQLNRSQTYTNLHGATGVTDNQLRALNKAGYFNPPASNFFTLPALAGAADASSSLEWRVRSWLAANCAQCHQPAALNLAPTPWDARHFTPTVLAGLVNGAVNNHFGNTNARTVAPGSLTNSLLFERLGFIGKRMPPLATSLPDTNGQNLLADWIGSASLAGYQTFAEWQLANFGSTNAPNALASADPDGDGLTNEMESQLGTNPTNAASDWKVDIRMNGTNAQIVFPHVANRGFEVHLRTPLSAPPLWTPLQVPGNAPFFSLTTFTNLVEDTGGSASNKTYRVRVFAP